MTNCEICDQELINGEFEEKLGICVNCIMNESRVDSYKAFFSLIALILGGFLFFVSSILVLQLVFLSLVGSGSYLTYLIPPLIVCLIIGPGFIYLIVPKSN